jgi:Fe-S cluster assembly ATPase SufC
MNIPLPSEIYGTSTIVIDPSKNVHVIIGPNGSGKSKLMDKLNDTIGNDKVKIIQGNINRINAVTAIDEETTKTESFQNKNIDNVVSLINAKVINIWLLKMATLID